MRPFKDLSIFDISLIKLFHLIGVFFQKIQKFEINIKVCLFVIIVVDFFFIISDTLLFGFIGSFFEVFYFLFLILRGLFLIKGLLIYIV